MRSTERARPSESKSWLTAQVATTTHTHVSRRDTDIG
jgi:hypothetical protein